MLYGNMFYYGLTIVMLILSLIASGVVKSRFRKYSKTRVSSGLTGAMAAERILRANGIYDVRVNPTRGTLTDNYNPTNKTLNLSEGVYNSASVSAVCVAAHECGHAIQHASRYPLLMLRKSIVPVANIGSSSSYIFILLGIIFNASGLIRLGALLFAGIVIFNFITLPVEINASRRALGQVRELGIVSDSEMSGGRKVLSAAAFTYFISLAASVVQFLRLMSIANRRR